MCLWANLQSALPEVYSLYIDFAQRRNELPLYGLFVTQESIVTFVLSKRRIMKSKFSNVILNQCHGVKADLIFVNRHMCIDVNCVNIKNLEGSFCVSESH